MKDLHDEKVQGTFFAKELQQAKADLNDVFKIETVIRSRRWRGYEKEYPLKWKKNLKKFNSRVKGSHKQDV